MAEEPTLAETIAALRDGAISAERVVESCLARIAEVDGGIQAWAFLDPDYARAQARAIDEARSDGVPMGPLHGIPIGIKDIFDTDDMPTEDGTVLHAGRRPDARLHRGLPAAAGRRGDHGQDGDHRAGAVHARQDPQSARSRAHARRLVERIGRRRRRRHGAAGDRLADQRLGDPPGVVLRRGRLQADARPDLAPRRAAGVAHARPCRRVRRQHRRCRAAGRGPDGITIAGDRRHAPAGAARPQPHGGRGAAAAAETGLRQDAGLGPRRGRHRARPSPSWWTCSATASSRWSCRRSSKMPSSCTAPSRTPKWRSISRPNTRRAATG